MLRRFSALWRNERGAALATVLVMVSVMSALAVAVTDAASMSIRRSVNQSEMEQARWYLLGAEGFAANRIADLERRLSSERIDQSEWQGQGFTFPLDEGAMRVTLWDGGNCFNLNSVAAARDSGGFSGDPGGQVQFARLLDLLEIRSENTIGLTAALVDWLDSDQSLTAGGAENPAYVHLPYRVGDTLLGDISELERVRGFDEEIVARLAPVACVRPNAAPNRINVNTLRPEQAPLLTMLLGGELSMQAAAEVIRTRPHGGWADIDAFFASPRLAALEISAPTRAYFDVRSSFFIAVIEVQYRDARENSVALLQAGGGQVRTLRRVFGAGAWEHAL